MSDPLYHGNLLLSLRRLLTGRHSLVEIRLIEVGQADPRETHVVNRARTLADPRRRHWVLLVRGRVVVPGDDVDDCSGWQQRGDIVGGRIRDAPIEVEVAHGDEHV